MGSHARVCAFEEETRKKMRQQVSGNYEYVYVYVTNRKL